MRELTNELPKPMLEVRGKPVLQHIVEGLRDAGLREFLIIVGYHADAVQNFLATAPASTSRSNMRLKLFRTERGEWSILRAILSTTPFILSYGDILVDPANYKRLVDLPRDVEAIVSVKRGEDVSKGGAVFLNERMELVDLREKPKPGEPTSPWYTTPAFMRFGRAFSNSQRN